MKKLWKLFLRRVCRLVLKRWFPWQYDVETKLKNVPRQHLGLDCTEFYDSCLETYAAQKRREKFLGAKFIGWLTKTGGLYFFPKVVVP